VGQVPFSSERKWMSTFHRDGARILACVKGAPGQIIARSSRLLDEGGGEQPLDDTGRARLQEWNARLADRGLRVLALARSHVRRPAEDAATDLTFVALVGIADPPATGVRETVALLRDAGVRTVMITGDQRLTAAAAVRDLALVRGEIRIIDGHELAAIPDDALPARLRDTAAVCRVSPSDKLRIDSALQRSGEIVAMLGDGVNDAAALRKADIGVAMGVRGTDVAKDAADMVLADDRFATVGRAVEEGRVVFDNIRKFVFYLFSCNLAEVVVLLAAGVAGVVGMLTPSRSCGSTSSPTRFRHWRSRSSQRTLA
jgi:Ca2+-transporting ATPase